MSADKKVKFDDLIRTGRDVDALRYFAKEYYDNGKMGHTRKMLVEEAADLIESLQAEITQLKDELADYNCDTKVGCKLIEEVKAERDAAVAENERLAKHGGKYIQLSDERYKMYEKAVKRAEDAEIKLAESQRRERAAVADIMCDNYIDLAGYAACAGELATEGDCLGENGVKKDNQKAEKEIVMNKMKRLTTDEPKDNFSMAMNYVYDKDHEAFIRHDGRTDTVPLYQYIDRLCEERGCEVEEPRGSEQTDWRCCDCAMDSEECPISMMYTFACQAVRLRARLKMYEDAPNQDFWKAEGEQ